MNARRILGRGATALLVGVVLAMVVAAVAVLVGWRALIVHSDGMEPAIPAGSVVLTRPVDGQDVRVGDVVSIRTVAGDRLTRRVVAVKPARGGEVSLTAKPDTADSTDTRAFAVTDTDLVYVDVPVVGRVVDAIVTLPGLLVVFILVVLINMRRRSRSRSRTAPSGIRG